MLRGVRGFYGDHEPFADRLLSPRRNVPVHTILVHTPDNVLRWWPIVDEVTREAGVVTSEPVSALDDLVPRRTPAQATERRRITTINHAGG